MPASPLVDLCLELLAPLGAVRSRHMFGGRGIYVDDLFVGIVAFDRLYLKTDPSIAPQFAAAGSEPFVYEGQGKAVTMGYWTAPAKAMESAPAMAPWGRLAMQSALAARAAKATPRKSAVKAAPRPARQQAPRKTAVKRAR